MSQESGTIQPKEYATVKSSSIRDLDEIVNAKLQRGWHLFGRQRDYTETAQNSRYSSSEPLSYRNEQVFIQVMVRY